MRVLAWDETGNHKVAHDVCCGDFVDWKRNGYCGTMRCMVIGLRADKVQIRPVGDGARTRWVKPVFSRVYDFGGRRKQQLPQHMGMGLRDE